LALATFFPRVSAIKRQAFFTDAMPTQCEAQKKPPAERWRLGLVLKLLRLGN
jgi:hypothetical protein